MKHLIYWIISHYIVHQYYFRRLYNKLYPFIRNYTVQSKFLFSTMWVFFPTFKWYFYTSNSVKNKDKSCTKEYKSIGFKKRQCPSMTFNDL